MSSRPIIACKRCKAKKLKVRITLEKVQTTPTSDGQEKLTYMLSAMMNPNLQKLRPRRARRASTLTLGPTENMLGGKQCRLCCCVKWSHLTIP